MHLAVFGRALRTFRLGVIVQRPIAGFPVIDAAAVKLREHGEHRFACCSDQMRPRREFVGVKRAALPNWAWRIGEQVTAVHAVSQKRALRRQRNDAAGAFEQD